jgi:pyruvate kinase
VLAHNFKRTKIIATIGPASRSGDMLERMIKAGVNGIRLNLSHGTQEEHAAVIKLVRHISKDLAKPVAIIADLQGPKIRLGALPTEGLALVRGRSVAFGLETDFDRSGIIPVQHDISRYVQSGQKLLLRDGQIEVKIDRVGKGIIHGQVTQPGIIKSSQGINLPETDLAGDIFTPKDLDDLKFAAAEQVDYVALSFVQSERDISSLKRKLARLESSAAVIAKIETRAAVNQIDEIIAASDGVMVARGDLATEAGTETVPVVQDYIRRACQRQKKISIVATQMLESMVEAKQPTRAEVSDVATAVSQKVDAVMLSGETAAGKFPLETVEIMKKVIIYTEKFQEYPVSADDLGKYNAIAAAAIVLARRVEAKVIIAGTSSGQTALNLAAYRPPVPLIVATDDYGVYSRMALLWGSKAFLTKHLSLANDAVLDELKKAGNLKSGDQVVVAYGHHRGVIGGTDTIQVKVVE